MYGKASPGELTRCSISDDASPSISICFRRAALSKFSCVLSAVILAAGQTSYPRHIFSSGPYKAFGLLHKTAGLSLSLLTHIMHRRPWVRGSCENLTTSGLCPTWQSQLYFAECLNSIRVYYGLRVQCVSYGCYPAYILHSSGFVIDKYDTDKGGVRPYFFLQLPGDYPAVPVNIEIIHFITLAFEMPEHFQHRGMLYPGGNDMPALPWVCIKITYDCKVVDSVPPEVK